MAADVRLIGFQAALCIGPADSGLVGLDCHAESEASETLLVHLGLLFGCSGHNRSARRMDLVGVLVCLRSRHARDNLAQCHLDIIEGMALAIENNHLVWRKNPGEELFVDIWADGGDGHKIG